MITAIRCSFLRLFGKSNPAPTQEIDPALSIPLPCHLALFPFVKHLGKHGWLFRLPGDDKSRLLRIALVLDVAEYQDPAFAQIFVEFTARREFGGQFGFLYIQVSSTSLFFAGP